MMRAFMSEPGGERWGFDGPESDPEAQAFAVLWALDEAQRILAETEGGRAVASVGTLTLRRAAGVWPVERRMAAALADDLRSFVEASDPAAYLWGLQTCTGDRAA
jgi:hypothetical protein